MFVRGDTVGVLNILYQIGFAISMKINSAMDFIFEINNNMEQIQSQNTL